MTTVELSENLGNDLMADSVCTADVTLLGRQESCGGDKSLVLICGGGVEWASFALSPLFLSPIRLSSL